MSLRISDLVAAGILEGSTIRRTGGTSSQFLKADGSVDSNSYLTGITSGQVTTALGYTPVQPNGTGASGTWGINISGNSATTTNFRHLGAGVNYDVDRTTKVSGGVAVYSGYSTGTNRPTTYDVTAQFNVNGAMGFEIAADWISTSGPTLFARSLRDCCQNWSSWITLITSLNIGSQSVSYATTAGALTSMNISQFTNNSGYVTGGPYLPTSGGTLTGVLTISTIEDGKLVLRAPAGDTSQWNYINFVGTDGVRDAYLGTDGGGAPQWWRDDNNVNITLGSNVNIGGGGIVLTAADADVRTNRGRFQVYNNAGTGNLGYRVRTDDNGGWRWQFVDGSNVEYFGVSYPGGVVSFLPSSGTIASRGGFSDFIGYNPSYGSYIGGGAGNAGNYLYAGGFFWDGGTIRTLWHSGNFTPSNYLPLSGGTMTGKIWTPSSGSDAYGGAIEIRERGYASDTQSAWSFSPAISFHWGNRHAKRFGMRADGLFAVDDAPIVIQNGGTWGINISGNAATASRVVSGTSTLAGVTFGNTMLATQTVSRVVNFDGNGAAPSVWWTNGSTPIGAIDAIGGGGLSFWSNNGSSWQQQVSMTHGTFNVLTALQQGGNQVLHASNYSSYNSYTNLYPTNTWVGNAIYFGGGNNFLNWDGARINANVGIQSGTDMRAPIFYDSNDTNYYGDFAGTSNFNIVNAQGLATAGAIYFAGAYGNTYNSDTMFIQGRYVAGNVQALDLYIGDDGRNTTLPQITGGQDGSIDALCIRATNDGIHHIFDSAGDAWHGRHLYTPNGNMYMGGNIVATQTWVNSSASVPQLSGWTLQQIVPFHSGSDFVNGTLVVTSINAAVSFGDSFVMEVTGKSYGSGPAPFGLMLEGYIYYDTFINVGAISYGSWFPGPIRILNYNGNLAFWWPRGSYWNSFSVRVREAGGSSLNRVTSILDVAEPASSKKVSVSVIQNLNTSNYNSYAPTLTGGGASGTWNINTTGTLSNGYFYINGNGYSISDADQWPHIYWLRDTANGWDEGLIKGSSARGFFGRSGWGIHMHSSRNFTFFSSGWDALFGIEGSTGNVKAKGIIYSGYNTATGRPNLGFNTSASLLGNIHIQNGAGPGDSNSNQAAITFQGSNSSQAQAGIYVLNNNSYGTSMGFAVTESYGVGPQLFMTATNNGVVNFPRATPTVFGNAVLHGGNYTSFTLPIGGGWYGSGLPGSRWGGYAVNGGEIVFGRDLPNNGQMGILVDGCYVAGENNGFWSMGSDNTWGSRRGMYWDGSQLNFTTNSPVGRFSGLMVDCGAATGRSGYAPGTLNIILNSSSSGSDGVCGIDFRSGNNYPSDGASIYFENSQTGSGEVARLVLRVENDLNDSILIRAGYHVYNARTVDMASQGADNPVFRWQYLDNNIMALNSGGTLTCSGDIVAYGSPSDIRLKTIKEAIQNPIEKVMKISGYRFDWNKVSDVLDIKEDVGVIAQEIAEVLPELARTNDNGYMSVRYQGLTALLIEAIKEQQKQIEELKSQIQKQ